MRLGRGISSHLEYPLHPFFPVAFEEKQFLVAIDRERTRHRRGERDLHGLPGRDLFLDRKAGLGIVFVVIISAFLMWLLFDRFAARESRRSPLPEPMAAANPQKEPPDPRLQPAPVKDLAPTQKVIANIEIQKIYHESTHAYLYAHRNEYPIKQFYERGTQHYENAPLQQHAKVFAFDKLKGDEVEGLVFTAVEHAGNVFVVELGGGPCFLVEAANGFRIGGCFERQNLQGNQAVQLRIPRSNDGGHAADADRIEELEMRQVPAAEHAGLTAPDDLE